MHVRVLPSRSTMMYVNGELFPGSTTTLSHPTPSRRNSSRIATPAPSSESLVKMDAFARAGVRFKGVRGGVERRRGRGLKARDPGRRDTPRDDESPQGSAFTTRTRSYGDQCEIDRTRLRAESRHRDERVPRVPAPLRLERVRAELRVRLGERRDGREVVHARGAHAHDHGRGGVAAGRRLRDARARRATAAMAWERWERCARPTGGGDARVAAGVAAESAGGDGNARNARVRREAHRAVGEVPRASWTSVATARGGQWC